MPATGRHVLRLSGYAPALPTPFDDAGELDLPALERLCHRQVEERGNRVGGVWNDG